MSPLDGGDGVVRFVLYDLTKPQVPSCPEQSVHVDNGVYDLHDGFTLALLDSLFSKGLCIVKSIHPKCQLGFSRILKGALDKVIVKPDDNSCWVSLLVLPLCLLKTFRPRNNIECKSAIKHQRQEESIVNAIRSWGMPGDVDDEDLDLGERNIKQCKRKICNGHYTAAVRVLSSSGVSPYSDASLEDIKTKHPFQLAPSLPHIPIDHHPLIASSTVVLDRIKSFPRGASCGQDGLRAQHLMDCLSKYITNAPLTLLVKPDGGIRPIAVGTVWRGLVSKAILHAVNRLLEGCGDDVGLSMLLVGFKNAFNLVDREVMLREVRFRCPGISSASGPRFGDWQWRLATLPFAFGGIGVYSAGDVLNYAFLASRLQFAGLQNSKQ
ncbi:hypothetical protein Tco_0896964 [Tanacetum coccineum]